MAAFGGFISMGDGKRALTHQGLEVVFLSVVFLRIMRAVGDPFGEARPQSQFIGQQTAGLGVDPAALEIGATSWPKRIPMRRHHLHPL